MALDPERSVQDFKVGSLTFTAKYFRRDVTGLIRTMRRIADDNNKIETLNAVRNYIKESTSQA